MIRAMALYPRGEGTTFDSDYWLSTHMPLCSEKLPGLVRWEADLGMPDAPHHAAAHLFFESAEELGAALSSPTAGDVFADVPNYTNIAPVLSIHEVAKSSS
jgi:uncharacterized protein (TIGR02118 family)